MVFLLVPVHFMFLLLVLVSWCPPIIYSFAPSGHRISGWAVRNTNDNKPFFLLTSILNESLTISKEATSTLPYQQEIAIEPKVVKRKSGIKVSSRSVGKKPANIYTVKSTQEYREKVESFKDNIIVTRFYAKWCKVSPRVSIPLDQLSCLSQSNVGSSLNII